MILAPGISYFHEPPFHVAEIDNDSDVVETRVTPPHASSPENAITMAAHAAEVGATILVNGGYAGGGTAPQYLFPCGAARGFGKQHWDAYATGADDCRTSFGWSRAQGALFD